jgi:hypothetical protein
MHKAAGEDTEGRESQFSHNDHWDPGAGLRMRHGAA